MSKCDLISEKIKQMPLETLLRMAATAIEDKMSKAQLDFIFVHVEMALQKRRIMNQLGIIEDENTKQS